MVLSGLENICMYPLDLVDQFVPEVARQLAQALDLPTHQALEARADVTEHVPALHLRQDQVVKLSKWQHGINSVD